MLTATNMKLEWRTSPRCNYQTYVLYHLQKLQAASAMEDHDTGSASGSMDRSSDSGTPGVASSSSISLDRARNGEFLLSANEFDPFQSDPLIMVIIISGP